MATTSNPKTGTPITPRERVIVAGVARGLSNERIGLDLGISELGVKSHLRRIGHRYGIHCRAGIVATAYRSGDLNGLPAEARDPARVTARERQVLDGMARGLGNPEIGEELFITGNTVSTHARRIFAKLRAENRAHAVALAHQHGYLPLPQPAEAVGRAA